MNSSMDEVIWKDVEGFEGIYKVSDMGDVLSVRMGRVLKRKHNNRNYAQVCLHRHGKQHYYLLHRLVAMHFIPNPNNLPQINHIDEDKENCSADNLEWCTNSYNAHYGTRIERTTNNPSYKESRRNMQRAVVGTSFDGMISIRLDSIATCERIGFQRSAIQKCLHGKSDMHKGFRWEYCK